MGLDISVYEKVEFVRVQRDRDDWDDYLTHLSNEECFRERSDGLADGFYRTSGKRDSFRAGSYSGYNEWRSELGRLVGVQPRELWYDVPTDAERATPFYELLCFSDCEGFIGPKTSAKLAKDFAAWADKANRNADSWFAEKYKDWRAAFELAANGGVVRFC